MKTKKSLPTPDSELSASEKGDQDPMDKYETEHAAKTITDVMGDPKKLAHVQKHMKKQAKGHKMALRSISGLKKHLQDNYGGPNGGPKDPMDVDTDMDGE